MKCIYVMLFFLLLNSIQYVNGQTAHFTKQQISEDLKYLKTQLLNKHPNSTNAGFQNFFEKTNLPATLTSQEAYCNIAATSSIIKDGHTLFYPNSKLINHNNENQHFIPLKIFWDGTNLFVQKNYSNNTALVEGAKITSINGVKSENLIPFMLQNMMRDGDNFNYPIWVLNNYFFEYYSYFYGCPTTFNLKVATATEKTKTINIKGLLKADLLKRINNSNSSNSNNDKAIYATFNLANSTATLTIKDWHNSVLKKHYKQKFKKEIKAIFEQIENHKIQHLIIDVRNNQGGDIKNSKILLAYLLDQPFKLVEGYRKIKDGRLIKSKGPQIGIHKPRPKPFKGKLFILINGGSFSNTGIFCSVLQKYNRAIFIGEETGGSEFQICSKPKGILLPNTKIRVEIPTLQFVIKETSNGVLHGIKPHHEIKPTINSLLAETDVAKAFTLELIKK